MIKKLFTIKNKPWTYSPLQNEKVVLTTGAYFKVSTVIRRILIKRIYGPSLNTKPFLLPTMQTVVMVNKYQKVANCKLCKSYHLLSISIIYRSAMVLVRSKPIYSASLWYLTSKQFNNNIIYFSG